MFKSPVLVMVNSASNFCFEKLVGRKEGDKKCSLRNCAAAFALGRLSLVLVLTDKRCLLVEVFFLPIFYESTFPCRSSCLSVLRECGYRDPLDCLPSELESWDTWSIDDIENLQQRKNALKQIAKDWLNKYFVFLFLP